MRNTLRKIVDVLDGQPRGRKGQSLVEMTLTFPILIMMVLCLVEIGYAANNYLILMDLVREAGRRGANLNPNGWNDRDTRNFERMDCETAPTYFGTGDPTKLRRKPRGYDVLSVAPYNYIGYPYDPGAKPPHEGPFGFFDSVVCQIILSMNPLLFESVAEWQTDTSVSPARDYWIPPADQIPMFGSNEIAVSAVAFAKVDFRHLDANGKRVPYGGAVPPGGKSIETILGVSGTPGSAVPASGTLMMVTRRYPTANRYCADAGSGGQPLGDYRDPNNWQRATIWKDGASQTLYSGWHDTTTPLDPNEIPPLLEETGGSQNIRGFIFTAQQRTELKPGVFCYGSRFTVGDIEALLNQSLTASNLPEKLTNGGLVIVEMWWQHHPLILAPLFNFFNGNAQAESIYGNTGGNPSNDPVLYVYAIFPANAAEPTATPVSF